MYGFMTCPASHPWCFPAKQPFRHFRGQIIRSSRHRKRRVWACQNDQDDSTVPRSEALQEKVSPKTGQAKPVLQSPKKPGPRRMANFRPSLGKQRPPPRKQMRSTDDEKKIDFQRPPPRPQSSNPTKRTGLEHATSSQVIKDVRSTEAPKEQQNLPQKQPSLVEGGILGDLSQFRETAYDYVERQTVSDTKKEPTPSSSSPSSPKMDLFSSEEEMKELFGEMLGEMDSDGEEGIDADDDYFPKDNVLQPGGKSMGVQNSGDSGMDSMNKDSLDSGFDMDDIFGTGNLDDILKELDAATDKDEDDGEGPSGEESRGGGPGYNTEMHPDLDLSFSEDEARMFVEKMKNVDLNDLLEGKTNLIGDFEDKLGKKWKGSDFEDEEWENPFDKLVWNVAQYLFPRRKKTNRQNWDHINVSHAVKEKRRKKKERGFAIWLSMEISKASNEAKRKLRKVPPGSEDAQRVVEKYNQRLMGFLTGYAPRLTLWNLCTMIQRFALVASIAKLEDWALARYDSLLITLLAGVRHRVGEMDARQVSEIVWAFGKLGPGVFRAHAPVIQLEAIPDRADVDVTKFYGDVMKRAMDVAETFSPQDVASFAYGVSVLPAGMRNPGGVGRLLDVSASKVERFNPQDMANLAWSLANMGLDNRPEFVAQVVAHAEGSVSKFGPHASSMLVKALGSMAQDGCDELLFKVLDEIKFRDALKDFGPRQLVNFTWGLAKLRYYPPPWFFAALEEASLMQLERFNAPETCILLWALATWGMESPPLVSACKSKLMFIPDSLSCQDVVSSAWCLAVLGVLDDEYLTFCVDELNNMDLDQVRARELRQLHQCQIDGQVFSGDSRVLSNLPSELLLAAKEAWRDSHLLYEAPEEVQDALQIFEKNGKKCEPRTWVGEASLVGSVVEFGPGVKCLLEVSSPEHRFRNEPNLSLGKVRWREKVLASLGYFVLKIDPTVWNCIDTDEEKLKYLNGMI